MREPSKALERLSRLLGDVVPLAGGGEATHVPFEEAFGITLDDDIIEFRLRVVVDRLPSWFVWRITREQATKVAADLSDAARLLRPSPDP